MSDNFTEKTINFIMMLRCGYELERHGVQVVYSRLRDEYDPVSQEVAEANASGADIAVSIHNNAGNGDGFEYYCRADDEKAKLLGGIVEHHIKQIGQNSRGMKNGSHLYFLRNTKIPALLVEGFFLDNKTDRKIADTVQKQEVFGLAYAKAILEYMGIEYKEPAEKRYTVQTTVTDEVEAQNLLSWLKGKGYNAIIREE